MTERDADIAWLLDRADWAHRANVAGNDLARFKEAQSALRAIERLGLGPNEVYRLLGLKGAAAIGFRGWGHYVV